MIESARNPRVKLARRLLASRSTREREGAFVVEGEDLVDAALAHGMRVACVMVDDERVGADERARLAAMGTEVLPARPAVIADLSTLGHAPRMLAIVATPRVVEVPQETGIRLVLDGIGDPGNVGTIVRTAGAFGVRAVGVTHTTADAYGPKALRAGMGVTFALPIVPVLAADPFPGAGPLIVLDADGEVPLPELNSWLRATGSDSATLLVGSERIGPSKEAVAGAAVTVRIPHARSDVESLNAAVAASIALYELSRDG